VHAAASHLIESGAVRFEANEWKFEADATQFDSPAIGESFVDLSAIHPSIAEIVQAASVLGDEFDALTLARLLERDELAVEDQLALGMHYGVLERIGEIELPDDELTTSYRFAASHVRAALLRALPPEQRRALEQRRVPSAAGT
jgi:predicted ATPase